MGIDQRSRARLTALESASAAVPKLLATPVTDGRLRWIPWTPVLNQAGIITCTINLAHYQVVGKTCTLQCQLSITGTGALANDISVSGFPRSGLTANVDMAIGSFWYGLATPRCGVLIQATATTFKFQVDNSAGLLGTAPSIALANGQVLSFTGVFETV